MTLSLDRLFRLVLVILILTSCMAAQSGQGCLSGVGGDIGHGLHGAGHGFVSTPKAIFKPRNLAWEIPVGIVAGALIAGADSHLVTHSGPTSLQDNAQIASNVIIGSEVGTAVLISAIGCAHHNDTTRRAGVAGVVGLGYALGLDLALKAAFNRQYPNRFNGTGDFWGGGKSFPSGHSSSAFGLASAIAHAYPNHPKLKIALYAGAGTIAVLRVIGRKHFPSDVLVGSALGFASGRAVGSFQ